MFSFKKFLNYSLWIFIAVFSGIFISNLSFNAIEFAFNKEEFESKNTYIYERQIEPKKQIANVVEYNKEVSMIFVGDMMLDRDVLYSVNKNGNGDFSFIFENIDFLKDTDIVFGNLEGPVSDIGEDGGKEYSFRMKPEILNTLKEKGFNVLSVANNHSGDWGREAFKDTLFRLKNENILAVGGGYDKKDAENVKIIEINGLRIGFLAFNDIGSSWMAAKDDLSGILMIDDNFDDIIKVAAEEVEYLIVSVHFGDGFEKESNARQKDIAKSAIDFGANILIGHHPHVIQEIERYNGGIIAYSLGNFIFDQNFSEDTMEGLVIKVIINEDGLVSAERAYSKQNKFYQPSLFQN